MNYFFRKTGTAIAALLFLPFVLSATTNLPAGTSISVTTSQSLNSKNAKTGQSVEGSVSRDVTVDGRVVIPKGSTARLVVASAQASGHLSVPAPAPASAPIAAPFPPPANPPISAPAPAPPPMKTVSRFALLPAVLPASEVESV